MGVARQGGGPVRFLASGSSSTGMRVDKVDMTALSGAAPFRMSRFWIEPGGASPLDQHDEGEIWMVAAGAGELDYGGQLFPVRAGDVFEMAPRVGHLLRNRGEAPLLVFSVWWDP